MKKEAKKSIFFLTLIILVFFIASYLAQKGMIFLEKNILISGVFGKIAYVLIILIETVLAPLTVLPLIPIASSMWGPIATAFLSVIGWASGSVIAFGIARRFGLPLIEKITTIEKINKLGLIIPERNIFLGLILLRIMVPVDILSYVLGLFPRIKWRTYTFATLIGIIPGAFLFSYIGSIPIGYQVTSFVVGLLIVALFILVIGKKDYSKRIKKLWDKVFR
mgnify:CR=1 FL=1